MKINATVRWALDGSTAGVPLLDTSLFFHGALSLARMPPGALFSSRSQAFVCCVQHFRYSCGKGCDQLDLRAAPKKKIAERVFVSEGYRVTRASGSYPVVKIGGTSPPTTVALIRGIPFFGFDPVVKIGGTPLLP